MGAKIDVKRKIITPSEREGFEKVIQQENWERGENAEHYAMFKNGDSQQVKNIKRTMREGEVDTISEHEKNLLEKRLKEINEWMSKNMVPKSHVQQRPSINGSENYEFRKAVNAMVKGELSAEYTSYAQERRNILLQLNRPEELSTENIRPNQ